MKLVFSRYVCDKGEEPPPKKKKKKKKKKSCSSRFKIPFWLHLKYRKLVVFSLWLHQMIPHEAKHKTGDGMRRARLWPTQREINILVLYIYKLMGTDDSNGPFPVCFIRQLINLPTPRCLPVVQFALTPPHTHTHTHPHPSPNFPALAQVYKGPFTCIPETSLILFV